MSTSEIQNRKFPDISGGLIFISGGLILLLNNFEVIPWTIWTYIANFWPVLIIFIGLDLISNNTFVLKFITTLISISIIIFVFTYSLSAVNYNFRTYLFKSYPSLQKIYQIIPNSPGSSNNQTPNFYRLPLESGRYYSN